MENQVKSKRLVWVGCLTLATVLFWVALDSYRELVRKDKIEKLDYLLKPIKPQLESEVMDRVNQKKRYQIEEIDSFFQSQILTPTSVLVATESGEER